MTDSLALPDFLRICKGILTNPNLPTGPLEKSLNSDKLDQDILNDHENCDQDDKAAAHILGIDDEVSALNLKANVKKTLADLNLPIGPLKTSQNSNQLDQHLVNDHWNSDEADVAAALVMGIVDEIRSTQQKQ